MANATVAQLKRDFEHGYLVFWIAERTIDGSGWHLVFHDNATNRFVLVDARSKMARLFKTADAAIEAVRNVGFVVDSFCR